MSKKVLILSGSPRKNGNSDILCDEFAKGATEAGHNVEKFMCPKRIYTLVLLVTIAVKIAVRVYLRTIWLRFYKND